MAVSVTDFLVTCYGDNPVTPPASLERGGCYAVTEGKKKPRKQPSISLLFTENLASNDLEVLVARDWVKKKFEPKGWQLSLEGLRMWA